jgi:hypothetical protein
MILLWGLTPPIKIIRNKHDYGLKNQTSLCLNLKLVTNVNYFKLKEKKNLKNLFLKKKRRVFAKKPCFFNILTKFYLV